MNRPMNIIFFFVMLGATACLVCGRGGVGWGAARHLADAVKAAGDVLNDSYVEHGAGVRR